MLILQDGTGWGGRKLESPLQREHPVPAKGTNSALQPPPRVTSEHIVVLKAFFSAPPSFSPLTQQWKDKPSGTQEATPNTGQATRLGKYPAD